MTIFIDFVPPQPVPTYAAWVIQTGGWLDQHVEYEQYNDQGGGLEVVWNLRFDADGRTHPIP